MKGLPPGLPGGKGGTFLTKQRRASNFSVLFLVLVIFLCLSWIWQMNSSAPQLDYAQVRQLFQQEKVEELSVR